MKLPLFLCVPICIYHWQWGCCIWLHCQQTARDFKERINSPGLELIIWDIITLPHFSPSPKDPVYVINLKIIKKCSPMNINNGKTHNCYYMEQLYFFKEEGRRGRNVELIEWSEQQNDYYCSVIYSLACIVHLSWAATVAGSSRSAWHGHYYHHIMQTNTRRAKGTQYGWKCLPQNYLRVQRCLGPRTVQKHPNAEKLPASHYSCGSPYTICTAWGYKRMADWGTVEPFLSKHPIVLDGVRAQHGHFKAVSVLKIPSFLS